MTLKIARAIAAVRPIILAVVVSCGLLDDLRAVSTRVCTVGISIVDEKHDALAGRAIQ